MRPTMEANFDQASSQNLPKVDVEMLAVYFKSNLCQSAENRGVKAGRATRPTYGDEAVGWVQVHRDSGLCTIKARVCPEHKIHDKGYSVSVVIDEENERIEEAQCHDCAAAAGGCKHVLAFVAWLHRRSEEPSPTEITCYWKKSRLSSVGSKIKCMTIGEIVKEAKGINPDKHIPAPASSTRSNSNKFLQRIIERGIQEDKQNHLVEFFKPRASWEKISLHHLALSYSGNRLDIDEFLNYCQNSYTYDDCAVVANCTKDQSESPIWYEMRYGRITASILYETCCCRTTEGALFREIMGGKMIESDAMARGRELEAEVIKIVEELIGEKITKSGLLLSPMYPWFGASPYGVTQTAVIEVKCPMKVETVSNYYANNTVNPKFRAQMQLQMFFAGKQKAKFCIADPRFPIIKRVTVIEEEFDPHLTNTLIQQASAF